MREVKFRAWNIAETEMIPFEKIEYLDFLDSHINYRFYVNDGSATEEIQTLHLTEVELMQYTGLKDKNGKEIYEGDLLRRTYNPDDEWEKVNYVAYEVFFHDNDCADKHIGFQMNRVHFQGSICGTSDFINFLPKHVINLEVIGNIYENPELLKS